MFCSPVDRFRVVLSIQYSVLRGLAPAHVAVILALIALAPSWLYSAEAPDNTAPAFADVRAILAAKCLACHGKDSNDLKGDYDLRNREAALKGGESGDAAI